MIQVIPEAKNVEVFKREVDHVAHEKNIDKLNTCQTAIFNEVITTILAQQETEEAETIPPVRLFVSGTAGTGKSFLINTLADEIVSTFGNGSVILAAYTGIAALHIKGNTCHSTFAIHVSQWKPLNDEKLARLRDLFLPVRLIIIDEISMMSNLMLERINDRLKEICCSNQLFGGKNLILLGDLLQLPPVQASNIFVGSGGENLFASFKYRELIANMRQGMDPLGEIMLRARVQSLTRSDFEQLQSRIITPSSGSSEVSMSRAVAYFIDKQREDPFMIALFGTNAEVAHFNSLVMSAKAMDVVCIPAEKEDDSEEQNSSCPPDLAIGARVMLRRNINIHRGLVNGARGVLVDIVEDGAGFISTLIIRFDGHAEDTEILRMNSFSGTGLQFPVVVAFGVTVHKCQGLTLRNVLINMKGFFGRTPGMAFVALSRVTTLQGIHLMNLIPEKIKCSIPSLRKCNELRATIGLPPYDIPQQYLSLKRRREESHTFLGPRNYRASYDITPSK